MPTTATKETILYTPADLFHQLRRLIREAAKKKTPTHAALVTRVCHTLQFSSELLSDFEFYMLLTDARKVSNDFVLAVQALFLQECDEESIIKYAHVRNTAL